MDMLHYEVWKYYCTINKNCNSGPCEIDQMVDDHLITQAVFDMPELPVSVLADLPTELLDRILAYLVRRDLRALSAVSHRFDELVARRLYQHLQISRYGYRLRRGASKWAKLVREVQIGNKYFPEEGSKLSDFLRILPKIYKNPLVKLEHYETVNPAALEFLLCHQSGLRKISVHSHVQEQWLQVAKQRRSAVQALKISEFCVVYRGLNRHCVRGTSKLLELMDTDRLQSLSIEAQSRHLFPAPSRDHGKDVKLSCLLRESLVTLRLDRTNNGFGLDFNSLPNLKHLTMKKCGKLESSLGTFKNPKLDTFCFEGNTHIYPDNSVETIGILADLLNRCTSLRQLRIRLDDYCRRPVDYVNALDTLVTALHQHNATLEILSINRMGYSGDSALQDYRPEVRFIGSSLECPKMRQLSVTLHADKLIEDCSILTTRLRSLKVLQITNIVEWSHPGSRQWDQDTWSEYLSKLAVAIFTEIPRTAPLEVLAFGDGLIKGHRSDGENIHNMSDFFIRKRGGVIVKASHFTKIGDYTWETELFEDWRSSH